MIPLPFTLLFWVRVYKPVLCFLSREDPLAFVEEMNSLSFCLYLFLYWVLLIPGLLNTIHCVPLNSSEVKITTSHFSQQCTTLIRCQSTRLPLHSTVLQVHCGDAGLHHLLLCEHFCSFGHAIP